MRFNESDGNAFSQGGGMTVTWYPPLTNSWDGDHEGELSIDIEFENEWETKSDWSEDDNKAAKESELCFPAEPFTVTLRLRLHITPRNINPRLSATPSLLLPPGYLYNDPRLSMFKQS
jgi:hypothetical protein